MGRLVAGTFVSLDGVMQAPGRPDEDRSGGFEHGGWMAGFVDDEMTKEIVERILRGDVLLLGRRTYDIFAPYWPRVSADDPVAAKFNAMPKYVVSDSLERAEWNGTRIVRGRELADVVARLRAEPGREIQVTGSGKLLRTLIREDLVDAYAVWTFPLLLGGGKRLFGDGAAPAGLRHRATRTFGNGVVLVDYDREGEVRFGTVGID